MSLPFIEGPGEIVCCDQLHPHLIAEPVAEAPRCQRRHVYHEPPLSRGVSELSCFNMTLLTEYAWLKASFVQSNVAARLVVPPPPLPPPRPKLLA